MVEQAGRLQASIAKALGVEPKVKVGFPGTMNVYLNGEHVYSYKGEGRMLTDEEMIGRLRAKAAALTVGNKNRG